MFWENINITFNYDKKYLYKRLTGTKDRNKIKCFVSCASISPNFQIKYEENKKQSYSYNIVSVGAYKLFFTLLLSSYPWFRVCELLPKIMHYTSKTCFYYYFLKVRFTVE